MAIGDRATEMLGENASLGKQILVKGASQGLINSLYGQSFAKGFAAGGVGILAEAATGFVGDTFTGEDKGGIGHGLAHFLVQGTSEGALAYLNGARGSDVARAFGAGGTAAFATTMLGDTINGWSDGNAAQQQWLSGEIGKAVGAAFGNEGAGFSGSTREVTYNYLKHDEARALIEARKNGNTEEVARLETLDRARDKELAAAAIQGGAKYTKLLREAQTAAAGYFGNQDLLGMDAAGEAEYVRDLKHANDVVENVTEFSGALALGKGKGKGKATVTGDPLGDWKINFEGGTQIEKPDSRHLRGSLSERYETGGRGPGTVSTGVGDLGEYRMEATSSLLRWVAHRNFWPPTVSRGRPDLRTWIRPYAMANLPRCGERLAAPNPTLFSRHSIISSRKLIMMSRSRTF